MPRRPIADARFWERVEKTGTCWVWMGPKDRDGYGLYGHHGRAHRLAWESANGPIPSGLCVLHQCDTPACVRPDHLLTGTHADNVADRVAKGRTARGERHGRAKSQEARGSANPMAKLDERSVAEIRRRYAAGGTSTRKLAAEFGVSQGALSKITRRFTWKHV